MVKLSLSKEIAERAEQKFPDYEITFDLPGYDIAPEVKFRNLIRLSEDERVAYYATAKALQAEVQAVIARVRESKGDPESLADLERYGSPAKLVEVLRSQLVILADGSDETRRLLEQLPQDQVFTIHSIVTADQASGESQTSPRF